jgi:hypothetical protein
LPSLSFSHHATQFHFISFHLRSYLKKQGLHFITGSYIL